MRKGIVKISLIICFLLIIIFSFAKISLAKDVDTSIPEFYGTVGINLKVGDTLDLKNSMFRIFAKDYYDGDLTNNIKILENNVNTREEGKYYIVYSVKNSQEVETIIEVPVNINNSGERTIKRKLYTTKYGWNTDLNKGAGNIGVNHDRQHLGIYTKAGATIKIRQTEKSYSIENKIKIDILNRDRETETLNTVITITDDDKNISNWQEITVEYDSVPFINTIDSKEEINHEIEVNIEDVYAENSKTKELTYYLDGDNEKEFIDKWNGNNDSFAVIESDRITLLVPKGDKKLIEDIIKAPSSLEYSFSSLKNLFEFYDEVFELNDKLIGLDFYAKEEIDKNERTKYFVKVDINGPGAAYYSDRYTAQSEESMSWYLQKGWGNLHEIGHGYEGDIGREKLNLSEAQNNIFAYYMQITYLNKDDFGWMGNISEQEETWNAERKNLLETETFNDLENKVEDHYHTRLYMMVNVLNKIGLEEGMSTLYKNSRRDHLNNEGKTEEADLIAKSFSEASGYNVIPYLESWHIQITKKTRQEIEEKNYSEIYYLRELVSQKTAETIKNRLGLEGVYSLVSNKDIENYIETNNIKGKLKIPFDQEFYNQFKNGKLIIKKDGIVKEQVDIINEPFQLELPVGIYTIECSNLNLELGLRNKYIIVNENEMVQVNLDMEYFDFGYRIDEKNNAIITEYLGNSTEVTVPRIIYPYTVTGIEGAFTGNANIEKITLPLTITNIEDYSFYNCHNLSNISGLSKVTDIGYASFYGCERLTTIDNLQNLENIGDFAFGSCGSLTSVGDLSNVTSIGNSSFSGCGKLTTIDNLQNVENIGDRAFFECKSLTLVGNLSKVRDIGNLAFYQCTSLKSVGSLFELENIGDDAFLACQMLDKIKIGKKIISIGTDAFFGCENLTIYGYGETEAEIYANNNNIKFVDISIPTVELIAEPTKVTYKKGEELNLSGGKITVTYEDGTTEEIEMTAEGVEVSGYDKTKVGEQTIIVTYEGNSVTFTVRVTNEITGIQIKTIPTKVTYKKGEELNLAGGKITVTYEDGTTEEIGMTAEGVEASGYDKTKVGEQTIIVTYKGYNVTFTINVIEEIIEINNYLLIVENDKNYITNVPIDTTIEEFKQNIVITGSVEIYIDDKKIEDDKTLVTTGMKLIISLNDESISYDIAVIGDITGDGILSDIDLLKLARYKVELDLNLKGAYLYATDLNQDKILADDIDLLKMARVLVGLDSL